jgi:hypothetical protein
MGETNSPSVAHMGYDISPLSRVKFNSFEWRNIVAHGQLKENNISPLSRVKFNSLEWRNIVTHGQLKENDISPLSRVKFKILTTRLTENLYV